MAADPLSPPAISEISVCIVVYRPDIPQLKTTIATLAEALRRTNRTGSVLIVDNSPQSCDLVWARAIAPDLAIDIQTGHGNIGFARGQNRALDRLGRYHLVLNPDVELAEDCLVNALAFMERNEDCGLLVPSARHPDGSRNYLCKRYPTLIDLLLRGFAPKPLRNIFRRRLRRYEMRDVIGDSVYWDPPIASGCFMFYRGSIFSRLNGFDEAYFLYFEDFDISLRTARLSRLAYVPQVRIVHFGGDAARKGPWHIALFLNSAVIFFRRNGWRLC